MFFNILFDVDSMCSVKDNIKSSVIIVLFVLCELCVTLDHEYSNEIAEML